MTRLIGRATILVLLAATTAGCGSARFGGPGPTVVSARPRSVPPPESLDPVTPAVPSGTVSSEPLPPPGGSGSFGTGPVVADVPAMSAPVETSPPPPIAVAPSGPSRSSSVGSYTARDATGFACRINLSSSSALDLYRASALGCQNKDLAKITAWDFRDGEVYLYQPGGAVAARLRGSSASLTGVLSKSGAPLTLTR